MIETVAANDEANTVPTQQYSATNETGDNHDRDSNTNLYGGWFGKINSRIRGSPIGACLAGYVLAKARTAVNYRQRRRDGDGSQPDGTPANTEPASSGWTPREPNDGGFATDKHSRGRIGGVRRER